MAARAVPVHLLLTLLFLPVIVATVSAQNPSDNSARNQMTSTVQGGSGLFNTFSTRTLKRGEFTFGVMWNNFDRDPGDLDINQVPVNFTLGLARRWEVFANWDVHQQVTSRQPLALSGPAFNAFAALTNDPIAFLGPPRQGSHGAAFFPNGGSNAGSILPALGSIAFSRGGIFFFRPNGNPGYYNDFPFAPGVTIGGASFLDFRQSASGPGNVTLGTKFTFRDPDTHILSLALLGLLRIPTSNSFDALSKGRGTGEVDWGGMLLFGEEWKDHRFRLYQNIGYIKTGDPELGGVILLDRRNELLANVGISFAASEHVEFLSELVNKTFVGGGTPNSNPVNPLDLQAGARFHFWDGRLSFGGAYRLFLNQADERELDFLNPFFGNRPLPTRFRSTDPHGFVVHAGIGRRIKETPPPPPPINHEPSVTCSATPSAFTLTVDSPKIALTASGSDPDNDVLVYRWTSTGGTISGDGPNVTLDLSGFGVGTYSTTVTVDDGRGGKANCTTNVTAKEKPNSCPSVRLVADPAVVTEGDNTQVTLRATASDPDGDSLTYRWDSTRGRVAGTGATPTFDTTGLQSGTVTVRVSVSDGKCPAQDSTTITIKPVPLKPTVISLTPCHFKAGSARVDNECKRFLQDAAQRLQQDPRMGVVIDGHSDKGEQKSISQKRAQHARDFLVEEMKVDANRIIVRSFQNTRPDPSSDRKLNRRIVITLVPEGAEMPQ